MTHTDLWKNPPEHPRLNAQEIHIWQASLEISPDALGSLSRFLSQDEMDRAKRFHFQKDHDRFIAARGILRLILGRYLNQAPATIVFAYNRYGKPFLQSPQTGRIRFNLSHANQLALYALSGVHEVGVDIEYIKPKQDIEKIIERFFSENEKREFQQLPEFMKTKAFFSGWTRKEAFIKARGSGLSIPLNKFSVALHPDRPAVLLQVDPDLEDGRPWSIHEIPLGQDYTAAVAVAGQEVVFRYWIWTAL
jgi:4'-phosphopantetheinyl transferase